MRTEEQKAKQRIWATNYYWSHRDKCRVTAQQCNMKVKLEVLTHYSQDGTPKCCKCGEADILVLCLDHINGGGSKQRKHFNVVGGVSFYRKLRKAGLPKGFQVLCANCNLRKEMIKTFEDKE